MNKILIIEDDESISKLIEMNLRRAGYECVVAQDGITGSNLMMDMHFDLGLFDIMVPGADGYELLEYAKSLQLPVIFLTAKITTMDKVKGLKLGADDYITKPFEIVELLARIEAVLRRYKKIADVLQVGDIEVDVEARAVRRCGEEMILTMKEFDLLLLFMRNPGRALYREVIYEQVWGGTYMGDSRTVDLHVQRIRKKLNLGDRIESIYKIGYRFRI